MRWRNTFWKQFVPDTCTVDYHPVLLLVSSTVIHTGQDSVSHWQLINFQSGYSKCWFDSLRLVSWRQGEWKRPLCLSVLATLITRFMETTWGSSGADRTQVGPMLAPWTLLSRWLWHKTDLDLSRGVTTLHIKHDIWFLVFDVRAALVGKIVVVNMSRDNVIKAD